MKKKIRHIVFDHDGTLVDVDGSKALFSGISELLDELSQIDVKLYVWTARTRFSTVEFLKSLGIIGRFEQLHCSTDPCPKPETQGLSDMLDGAAPSSVVVVGDSFADMIGAKNYGAYAIAALWADGSPQHRQSLMESGADCLAATVGECKEKIFEILN